MALLLEAKKSTMKNLLIAISYSLLPIYSFIAWIITANDAALKGQLERVNAYYKNYFFDLNIDSTILTCLNILLIIISIFFNTKFSPDSIRYTFLKYLFLTILILLGIFYTWTLL